MFEPEVSRYAKVIWDYHHMHQPLGKADIMLVLGSHDLRVPKYAARLFIEGFAKRLVISGGIAHSDDLLKTNWQKTEAEMFADVLTEAGIDANDIVLEKEAKNTGDNFSLSRRIIESRNIEFSSVLVITKPYMERRAFATGSKQWPDKQIIVSSPPISFDEYFSEYVDQETSPESILNIMMGDLQRIDIYGRKGFQIVQEIPSEVWEAFNRLKELGYTKHLLPAD
jgi:uncharacterized SAM-binding protein YcdF (DUF218 family)